MILIDGLPEIPGIMPREVQEIITRAVNAEGRISDRDAAKLTIAELCELEAMISTHLEANGIGECEPDHKDESQGLLLQQRSAK